MEQEMKNREEELAEGMKMVQVMGTKEQAGGK